MKVLIFGATGMVGQGVLRECLLDRGIDAVLTIGRKPTGLQGAKLIEIAHANMWHYDDIEPPLTGYDACFFCLGVSSVGMSEADYERVTYGIAFAAATTLSRLNPQMTFLFISGAGSDSTEQSRTMWARVKGKTENALLRMPFHAVYIFRPAFIQPVHGVKSKTAAYRVLYTLFTPLMPLIRALFPTYATTSEQLGRAMIAVARNGAPKKILESADINAIRV